MYLQQVLRARNKHIPRDTLGVRIRQCPTTHKQDRGKKEWGMGTRGTRRLGRSLRHMQSRCRQTQLHRPRHRLNHRSQKMEWMLGRGLFHIRPAMKGGCFTKVDSAGSVGKKELDGTLGEATNSDVDEEEEEEVHYFTSPIGLGGIGKEGSTPKILTHMLCYRKQN